MRLAISLGFGVLLGLMFSSLVSFSIWLDMRLHSYHVVWAGMICGGLWVKNMRIWHLFALEILLLILVGLGKYSTILYNFKESFLISSDIAFSNLVFWIFVLGLNLLCLVHLFKNKA